VSFASLFFQAEDGIRDFHVTGVQTCALPIFGYAPRHVLGHPPYTAVEVSRSTPSDLGSSLSIGPVPLQPPGTTAVPCHRTTSEEVGVGTPPGAVGRRRETPSLNQRRTEILKGLPLIEASHRLADQYREAIGLRSVHMS